MASQVTRLCRFVSVVLACLAAAPAAAQDTHRVFPLGGQRGTTVSLRFPGMDKEESAALRVDGPGLKAVGPFVKGVGQIEIVADAAPGVRQIRLIGANTATEPRPFAIGTLPETAEKEPNDSTAEAQVLSLPVVLNGAIPRGQDTDLYKVTLKKGDFLVMSGESRRLAAATYLAFHIRDAAGRALPNSLDVRRMDPVCTFAAPADGEYLIQLHDVTGNMGNVDEGSSYRLTLTTGPWIDFALPPVLPRGARTSVRLHGWNLDGKPGPGTTGAGLSVPAEAGATVPVSGGGAPNAVVLAVAAGPQAEEREPNAAAAPQPLSLPAAVSGAFESRGDVDAFQFTAKAKERLLFDVTAREWDSFADPVLTLLDASGKMLQSVDDADRGRDPRMVWTTPADGAYIVLLRDLAGGSRSGPGCFYHLRIGPAEPELRLNAEEATVTLKPGGKAELTLRLFQSFQPGEVTVTVEGLPAGVTAEPVKVAASPGREGSSQVKVALTAAAGAAPGFGVDRVTARAAGDPPVNAVAAWQRTGDGGVSLGSGVTTELLVLVTPP